MHAVHHRIIGCRVRSKIPGMSAMVPAAAVILATRSSSVSTTVSYTSCFLCPQRKKSRHVTSGDLGGQTTGRTRPIHRFPKVTLRWFLTAMLKWAGAISIHRPDTRCKSVISLSLSQGGNDCDWISVFPSRPQSSFECQYTFPVSNTNTTAYVSITNKMFPNITNWLQRPYFH